MKQNNLYDSTKNIIFFYFLFSTIPVDHGTYFNEKDFTNIFQNCSCLINIHNVIQGDNNILSLIGSV